MPTAIPTRAQFQKATDLSLATSGKRAGDSIINRIDALLDAYHATQRPEGQMVLLGRVFLATDLWLKNCDRGAPEINTRRRPAVYTFYKTVVARLSEDAHVPVNLLPDWLIATFGKSMGAHGAEVDLENRSADYLSPEAAAKYRLRFAGGRAMQRKWWENSDEYELVNTVAPRDSRQAAVIADGFAGYVVSMGGEFYTGPHWAGAASRGDGRFHSSYMRGESVLCAGEIRIKNGLVLEINSESGHYRPGSNNLFMAVETLAIVGVPMATVVVAPYGLPKQSGREFLSRFDRFAGQGLFTFDDARSKARPGDSPLSRHAVHSVQTQHAQAQKDAPSFALLRQHWKPRDQGGHGPAGRFKCEACKALQMGYWDKMMGAIQAGGGIDQARPK